MNYWKKTISIMTASALVLFGILGTGTTSAHAWDGPTVMTAVATVPSSGTLTTGDQLEVYLTAANQESGMTVDGTCTINSVNVAPSFQDLGGGLYELVYTVGANDANQTAGNVPINCTLQNVAGYTTTVSAFTDNNTVAIDTSTGTTTGTDGSNTGTTTSTGGTGTSPVFTAVATVPSSGTLQTGDQLDVYLTAANQEDDLTLGNTCTINGVAISPLEDESGGLYELVYTVGANDANQTAGNIPINCDIQNTSGGSTAVTAFTDGNTVAIDTGTGTTTGTDGSGGTGTTTDSGTGTSSALLFSQVAAVPDSGTLNPGDTLQVYFTDASSTDSAVSLGNSCTINDVQVSPLENLTGGLYKLTYTVGANDASQTAGQIPIDCMLQNATGATTTVTAFTDGNTVAINNSNNTSTGTGGDTGTTTGDINGTVGTDAPLSVTGITQVQSTATADNTFADGWNWTFDITVPNNQTNLQMEFGDWTNTANGSDVIPVAGNMEISSPQASTSTPVVLTGSNVFSAPLNLVGDADSTAPGRQVQVTVQMKIPTTAVNGSYTTNYAVQSSPESQ